MKIKALVLGIAFCFISTTLGNKLFECTFDNHDSIEHSCEGIQVDETSDDLFYSLTEKASIKPTSQSPSIVVTDITSIEGLTLRNSTCKIPFNMNNQEQYFCVDDECLNENNEIHECNLGRFLRLTSGKIQVETLSLEFDSNITLSESTNYILNFRTIFGCTQTQNTPKCNATSGSEIVISFKTTRTNDVTQVKTIKARENDFKWQEEVIKFKGNGDYKLLVDMSLANGFIYMDHLILREEPSIVYLFCNYDDQHPKSYCDVTLQVSSDEIFIFKSETGSIKLEDSMVIKVTDVTSIEGITLGNNTCQIPYLSGNTEQNFCYEDEDKNSFFCKTQNDDIDECRLGKFVQIVSNSDTTQKVLAKVTSLLDPNYYSISFRAIFGDASNNSINVFISKKLIGKVIGDKIDPKWNRYEFFYESVQDDASLEIEFNLNQGYVYVDELIIKCSSCEPLAQFTSSSTQVTPAKTTLEVITTESSTLDLITTEPSTLEMTTTESSTLEMTTIDSTLNLFSCPFDDSISLKDQCGGIRYESSSDDIYHILVKRSSVQSGNEVFIVTDVSSIEKPTLSGASCQIPFNFYNSQNYFCVEDLSGDQGDICLDKENNISECRLGNFLQISANEIKRNTFSFDFETFLQNGERYVVKMKTIYGCTKTTASVCGQYEDTKIKISIKREIDVNFNEIITINGRKGDFKWTQDEIKFPNIIQRTKYVVKIEVSIVSGFVLIDDLMIETLKVEPETTLIESSPTTISSTVSEMTSTTKSLSTTEEVTVTTTTLSTTNVAASTPSALSTTKELIFTTSTPSTVSEMTSTKSLSITEDVTVTTTTLSTTNVVASTPSTLSTTKELIFTTSTPSSSTVETTTTTVSKRTSEKASTTPIEITTPYATSTTTVSTTESTLEETTKISTSTSTISTSTTTIMTSTTSSSTTKTPATTTTTRVASTTTTTTKSTSTPTTITTTKFEATKPTETSKKPSNSQQTGVIAGSVSGAAILLIIGILIIVYSIVKTNKKVGVIDDDARTTRETVV